MEKKENQFSSLQEPPIEKARRFPPSHFDANDSLGESELKDAYSRADFKFKQEHSKELELEKGSIRVPNQEWVLVSFVGKTCSQKTEQFGMKIHGAFADPDSAKEHLKRLGKMEENKYYDIYILEMYSWAIIPPDPTCVEDQEYHDEKLNEIVSEHKKEKYRSKEVFDTRKEKLKQNPDINQFNRNKDVLKNISEKSISQLGVLQQKLPTFTLEKQETSVEATVENNNTVEASDIFNKLV